MYGLSCGLARCDNHSLLSNIFFLRIFDTRTIKSYNVQLSGGSKSPVLNLNGDSRAIESYPVMLY